MESRLTIGQSHLNKRGLVDATSIQETMAFFLSMAVREKFGLSIDQIEQEYSVSTKVIHIDILFLRDARLGDVCSIASTVSERGRKIAVRHCLTGGRDSLLIAECRQYICFIDKRGMMKRIPLLLNRRRAETSAA